MEVDGLVGVYRLFMSIMYYIVLFMSIFTFYINYFMVVGPPMKFSSNAKSAVFPLTTRVLSVCQHTLTPLNPCMNKTRVKLMVFQAEVSDSESLRGPAPPPTSLEEYFC